MEAPIKYLLTEREAAAAIGFKPRTLAIWRQRGGGPAFVKLGQRAVRYRPEDLAAWSAAHVRRSTSDAGASDAA